MHLFSPKNYFSGKISHGFVSLYTGKTIVMIASGLLGLFLPIFIYNLFGQNLQYTALYFAAGYFLYMITLFLGVRLLNKYGLRRALRTSIFLGALYYVFFYFVNDYNWFYFIPFVLIVVTLYRLCYWVPYHVDFAKFTSKKNRGKQISSISATRKIIGIFIPVLAGFVIARYGFDVLFVTTVILYLISGIPYLTIPRTRERFSWSYGETLKNFFSQKYRKRVIAFVAEGAENKTFLIIWPIFIFQLLKGDYLKLGIISTLIIAVSVILQLILGKKLDKPTLKEKILKTGSVFSSIIWVIKIFIETAFEIFIVGSFHNLIRMFARTPFQTISYEIAADEGHYVDEFTVVHELAINGGSILMLITTAILAVYLPIQYVFILAAVASLFLNLLRPHIEEAKARIG